MVELHDNDLCHQQSTCVFFVHTVVSPSLYNTHMHTNAGLFGEGPADRRARLRSILADLGECDCYCMLRLMNMDWRKEGRETERRRERQREGEKGRERRENGWDTVDTHCSSQHTFGV